MKGKTIWNAFATIVATMVGVGFISGKEIYVFFQSFGVVGYAGILVVFVLFFIFSKQLLLLNQRLKLTDVSTFHTYLFQGKKQTFFQGFVFISHMCIVCSMLAGLFWVIQQITFGVGSVWFILAIQLVLVWVVNKGVSCSYKIIAAITPFLLLMFIMVSSLSMRQGFASVSFQTVSPVVGLYAVLAGVLYAGMNLQTTSSVIVQVGSTLSKKHTTWVALGVSLCVMLFLSIGTLALWGIPAEMQSSAMPFYHLAQSKGTLFTVCYLIALFLGILTTLIASAQTATDMLVKPCKNRKILATCIVFGVGSIFASFGFQKVISYLYPFMGVLGVVYVCVLSHAIHSYVAKN